MMKQPEAMILFAVLLFGALAGAQGPVQQTETQNARALIFRASPTSSKFKLGQQITFEFKLKNDSHDRVLVARSPYPGFATVHLSGPDGKEVEWRGNGKILSQAYAPVTFTVLARGESVKSRGTVSLENGQGYVITAPGPYVAWAEYSMGPPDYFRPVAKGAVVPEGAFRSAPTKFWVEK